jgi:hypothetical protein
MEKKEMDEGKREVRRMDLVVCTAASAPTRSRQEDGDGLLNLILIAKFIDTNSAIRKQPL